MLNNSKNSAIVSGEAKNGSQQESFGAVGPGLVQDRVRSAQRRRGKFTTLSTVTKCFPRDLVQPFRHFSFTDFYCLRRFLCRTN